MRWLGVSLLAASAATEAAVGSVQAQETGDSAAVERIHVFLDCQTFACDFDHFRRAIPFVSWVRDRRDADVHVLATDEPIAGGGQRHTFAFISLRAFAGQIDTLTYDSRNTDTEAEVRDGQLRTVLFGLVRYIARTPLAEFLDITYVGPTGAPAAPAEDPWDLWVFTVTVGGIVNAESERRAFSGNGAVQANRTSENLKLDFAVSSELSRSETDIPDLDTTFVNAQERFTFDFVAVTSVGQRWSAGFRTFGGSNSFDNTALTVQGGPAVEFSIFPYVQSTRRQLTFLYTLGIAAFDYDEETVFGLMSEVRPTHVLEVAVAAQQPWGTLSATLRASQFLHDLSKHRVGLFGSLSFRLVRGIDLSLFAGASRVKDQLYISGAGLTPEERLLQTRRFETNFLVSGSLGLTFRFGSRYANVVNTRMQRFGGGL